MLLSSMNAIKMMAAWFVADMDQYDIVILDEEEVALSAAPTTVPDGLTGMYIAIVVAILLIAFLFVYNLRCMHYRKRLVTLATSSSMKYDTKGLWSIHYMKSRILEMESTLASKVELK